MALPNPTTEPVTLAATVTAALIATVAVLALLLDWSTDLATGLNMAIGAWVLVVSAVVRSRVTPTPR